MKLYVNEPYPENFVFVIEKASFWACFGNLKGGYMIPVLWTQYMYRYDTLGSVQTTRLN